MVLGLSCAKGLEGVHLNDVALYLSKYKPERLHFVKTESTRFVEVCCFFSTIRHPSPLLASLHFRILQLQLKLCERSYALICMKPPQQVLSQSSWPIEISFAIPAIAAWFLQLSGKNVKK